MPMDNTKDHTPNQPDNQEVIVPEPQKQPAEDEPRKQRLGPDGYPIEPQEKNRGLVTWSRLKPGETLLGGRGVLFRPRVSSKSTFSEREEEAFRQQTEDFKKALLADIDARVNEGAPMGLGGRMSKVCLGILGAVSVVSYVVLQLGAVFLFVWSIVLAYGKAGLAAAIITAIIPVLSQVYWAWALWPSSFSHAVVYWLLLSLVSPVVAAISAGIGKKD